jgi:hypothetical protein
MAFDKDQLLEICYRYGLPATEGMSNPALEELIRRGNPRPTVSWWQAGPQIGSVLVGLAAAGAGWYSAHHSSRSADASSRSAEAAVKSLEAAEASAAKGDQNYDNFMKLVRDETNQNTLQKRQQEAIYDILERELVANRAPLTFHEIEKRYDEEVIRQRKWGDKLAMVPFDSGQIRESVLNLMSLNLVYAVYSDDPKKPSGYTANQATMAKEIHRSTPILETKRDIIARAFEESGKHDLVGLRKLVPVERQITDREWALLVNDLIMSGSIAIEDGKVLMVGRVIKQNPNAPETKK